ncbi:MAG: ester cyclase [Paracoccaceae bacterium]
MERTPYQIMETYLLDVGAQGKTDLIPELAHADMVDEANRAFGGPPGRDGLVAHVKGFRRAFDDLSISVNRIIASEDEVMAWWTFKGRHVRPWLGRAARNGPLTGTVFSFFTLDAGRIRRYRLWLCAEFDPPVVYDSSKPLNTQGLDLA